MEAWVSSKVPRTSRPWGPKFPELRGYALEKGRNLMDLERLWGAKVPSISRNLIQRAPYYAERSRIRPVLSTVGAHSVDNLMCPPLPLPREGFEVDRA